MQNIGYRTANATLEFLSPWIEPLTVFRWLPTFVVALIAAAMLWVFRRDQIRRAIYVVWLYGLEGVRFVLLGQTRTPVVAPVVPVPGPILTAQERADLEEADMPWCPVCGSHHAVPQNPAHHAKLGCKAVFQPPMSVKGNEITAYFTTGLPAAAVESAPGDPPAGASLPAAAIHGGPIMVTGAELLGPGFVLAEFMNAQTHHQQPEACHDMFCWEPAHIHPGKVDMLKRRMTAIVANALATGTN